MQIVSTLSQKMANYLNRYSLCVSLFYKTQKIFMH